jgi:phthalate 4,5-dioxygenase
MGEAMRRYWMPALLSEEVPQPDCPPVRVRLLGGNLVAFRDSNARVGLLAENCAHRGASLFFGRNEECGLRCVYHGWKYDVDGSCVDMPNEPPESTFRDRVRQAAYPCQERGGVVWAYLGPPHKQPPLIDLEWMRLPRGHLSMSKTFESCNYLQGLEGGVDTSHSSFLHRGFIENASWRQTGAMRDRSTAPRLEVLNTDCGFTYAGIRQLSGQDQNYVRVYHFVMPFHQLRAFEGYLPGRPVIQGHMWVPIDDEHTWVYNWMYARDGSELPEQEVLFEELETGRAPEHMLPDYRLKANDSNDYLVDRGAQRTTSFTGIAGTNTQDIAIQESMGPLFDRSREHLGTSDVAVIATRRLLLDAAYAVQQGLDPLAVDGGSSHGIRPAEGLIPVDAAWQDALSQYLVAAS